MNRLDPDHHALLCFGDGGDGAASLVATALAQAAPVPMVGGTFAGGVALDGSIRGGGAVVALVASEAPLRAFEAHPFAITDQRTVVTACDDTGLVLRGLDGYPAVDRFGDLGVPESLDGPPDRVLAALGTQLAWVVQGRMLLRPVVGRRGTALAMGSPVQPGLVLRVVRRVENPVEALLRDVDKALSALAAPAAAAWVFACRSLLLGDPGLALREGLGRMGVVACAANGAFHGPVHSCGMLAGLVYGDVGR